MRTALDIEELKRVYGNIASRYDAQHSILTVKSDQKGRKLLVEKAVAEKDNVLDCGSGTGSTGILAAKKTGPEGSVTMFDLSDAMLEVARQKVAAENLQDRITFQTGDMTHLPFDDNTFDVVLSTYSLCPLYDPEKGALEMYRVAKPGGKIACAHSSEPQNKILKFLGDKIENAAWHFHWLSMGCRSVSVLPALQKAGGKVIFSKHIGVPLWPFFVFIVEKPKR